MRDGTRRKRAVNPPPLDVPKEDVVSFALSTEVDGTARYIQTGRSYAHIADGALFEMWERAFRTMAGSVFSDQLRSIEADLRREIRLRGLNIPFAAVTDAIDAIVSEVTGAYERLDKNSEEFRFLTDLLEQSTKIFKAKIRTTKN